MRSAQQRVQEYKIIIARKHRKAILSGAGLIMTVTIVQADYRGHLKAKLTYGF